MAGRLPRIVLTSGEPAGIGPDIACTLAAENIPAELLVIADPKMMQARADALGSRVDLVVLEEIQEVERHRPGLLHILPATTANPVVAGQLDPGNADYVLSMLRQAAAACMQGKADAIVTGPIHKAVINQSGVPFTGHTEFLAELTGGATPVMLLARPGLRVALVTTHLPLRDVSTAITAQRLESVLRIAESELRSKFHIDDPRVLVLGLNPHAGEEGTLGTEEQTTILPTLDKLRAEGLELIGPVPADTAFTPESLARCDLVFAMYHDQGLPALKAGGFGEIVNVTLGLPIIRTSVDHGTALGLAGTGRARHDSLSAAVAMAVNLAVRARESRDRT